MKARGGAREEEGALSVADQLSCLEKLCPHSC